MNLKVRNILLSLLLIFSLSLVFWKLFVLLLLPENDPYMNTWLRYIDHPLARSWVYFNRGNTQFEASLQEKDTSLS